MSMAFRVLGVVLGSRILGSTCVGCRDSPGRFGCLQRLCRPQNTQLEAPAQFKEIGVAMSCRSGKLEHGSRIARSGISLHK